MEFHHQDKVFGLMLPAATGQQRIVAKWSSFLLPIALFLTSLYNLPCTVSYVPVWTLYAPSSSKLITPRNCRNEDRYSLKTKLISTTSNESRQRSSAMLFPSRFETRRATKIMLRPDRTTDAHTMDAGGINGDFAATESLGSSEKQQQQSATTTTFPSTSSSVATLSSSSSAAPVELPRWKAHIIRFMMISYIVSMCIALPVTLIPQYLLYRAGWISRTRKERWALATGQFCARWLLRLIPFCKLTTVTDKVPDKDLSKQEPEPSVWVCNHTSMLDVFLLMAADLRLRGPRKRPIKVVYWKQLEDNIVSKLLFLQAGFIPVQMTANGSGVDNEYDKASFKQMLRDSKRAFAEGFDLGILPEGQLNPRPEECLMPVFSGAYTLAKMARRPIRFMALHGAHRLWHPNDNIGMKVTGRHVKVRCYQTGRTYASAKDFIDTFEAVVGHFGKYGRDLPKDELKSWLNGTYLEGHTTAIEPIDATAAGLSGSSM